MLRYLTAGESHGRGLVAILEGVPANLPVAAADLDADLIRRMEGYGRGNRMKIERDRAEILGGIRHGLTLGSPISLLIWNRDWEHWKTIMAPEPPDAAADAGRRALTRPRPGHADLAGGLKYDQRDLRNVLERASARETAARVAVGAVCKCLLRPFGIRVLSHVVELGGVQAGAYDADPTALARRAEESPVRCADSEATQAMVQRIDEARARGTSLGGVFEVVVLGLPAGLGTHVHWDRRLDGRLAQALMSIQAIKGVEIGLGFDAARRFGSEVMDEIFYESGGPGLPRAFTRHSNHSGGLEGGITTGQPLVLRAAMKPIATQLKPLASVDILTKEASRAGVERTDITAVPAASVVGEGVVAFEIAAAFVEKFGGDSLAELRRNHDSYLADLAAR